MIKKNIRLCFLPMVTAFLVASLIAGCSKDDGKLAVVTTADVTDIAVTSAISGGNVSDDGGSLIKARGVCWSTNPNPTVKDSKTVDGNGAGSFTSTITGLLPDTEYFVRAYALNKKGTAYGSTMAFRSAEGVADIDGNYYPIIRIGDYEWMAENLKTTRYNDGSNIDFPENDYSSWQTNTAGAFGWPNNDEDYGDLYGGLYNWYAVNTGKLCPEGWRVPTDDEWKYLEGMVDSQVSVGNPVWNNTGFRGHDAGKMLKAASGWPDNGNGTDDYGFSALPAGLRSVNGDDHWINIRGLFWTSTQTAHDAYRRGLLPENDDIARGESQRRNGYSVRCIRDAN